MTQARDDTGLDKRGGVGSVEKRQNSRDALMAEPTDWLMGWACPCGIKGNCRVWGLGRCRGHQQQSEKL